MRIARSRSSPPLLKTEITTRPDPGNGAAIAVDRSAYIALESGGAETRTLAVPTFPGQILFLNMITDGGDIVVTVTDPHIDGTNNTITFNDVGDTVILVGAKQSSSTYGWKLLMNVGASLSHV